MSDITREAIEYISRYKEQDEELHKIAPKNSMSYYATGKCLEYWDIAIEALENQKTGHWIEKDGYDGDTYYDCSECGESFCLIEGTPTDNLYNYCPSCGAKMEGENK